MAELRVLCMQLVSITVEESQTEDSTSFMMGCKQTFLTFLQQREAPSLPYKIVNNYSLCASGNSVYTFHGYLWLPTFFKRIEGQSGTKWQLVPYLHEVKKHRRPYGELSPESVNIFYHSIYYIVLYLTVHLLVFFNTNGSLFLY